MHQNLFRAVRRSFANFCDAQIVRKRAWKNGVRRTQPSHTFSGSHAWKFADFNIYHLRDNVGTGFVQLQVVNALWKGDRQLASKMLLDLGEVNDKLSAKDFACILEYCARTPDPLFAMETWKIMEDKMIDINKKSCIFILQAFSKGGYIKEAFNWLNFLAENDRMHYVPMFNIFLSGCWSSKSFNHVDRCLELMENQLVGKSEITHWELLKLAVLQRNLSAVHEIWKEYTRYYSPSVIMLRKFIWCYAKLGDLDSGNAALKHLLVLARQGSASLSISGTGNYQSSAVDIPIPTKEKSYEKRFSLDNLSSLTFEGNPEKNEGPIEVSMDESSMGHHSIMKNLELKKSFESQSKLNIIDALLLKINGNTFFNELGKGRCIPVAHTIYDGAVQIDSSNFQVKQEDFSELSSGKMKQGLEMTSCPLKNLLRWSFNDMIHACAQSNNYQMAEQLFLQMLDIGLKPSEHTYDGFVKAAIEGKGVDYGMKVVKMMQERNIKPYNNTFAVLSVGYSRTFELDMAESFSNKISDKLPKNIHTFNTLLAACGFMDEPERAVRVLAKIKRLKIKLNIRTYELMFTLFGTVNVPYERGNILSHMDVTKRIGAIEMDMMKNGIHHSYASMKNLIRALGSEGMIQDMLRYLDIAENLLWQTDAHQTNDLYNIVLHALVKAKERHKAIEVFRSMRSCGLPANVATYNIMIECCSMLKCFKSACAIISLMLREGFYPQTLTYTALIKVLLANEDFEGALNLLDQSHSEAIQLDVQLFNTILREAYIKRRIDVVELVVESMHREKIQPNPTSLWYTFSAYAESDFHSTAMEALQVLSMRMISEDNEILQGKKSVFEELILNEDPDVESEIIKTFKGSQEFLATALMNLRWCAIMGYSISWSPEESQWAKRLANKVST
ncbi:pentatricopeptide repeat-containing protein At1g76280-like isoform X3 [Musa acuminata AAA Group]|uniref:pentatricopeptide repeat-containing protein At1g76280-like isoform X3 n=1 Tax=Musa acuminata AAA Group TaxID=214697 RepID=UPI0031DD0491